MTFADIVFTQPANWLPEKIYLKYMRLIMVVYGIIYQKSGNVSRFDMLVVEEPFVDSKFRVCRISGHESKIFITSAFRVSRFLLGFEYAAMRQWKRYGIDTLVQGEVPQFVIDIGANVGEFTHASVLKGAEKVLAFEPDRSTFYCLLKNISSEKVIKKEIALSNLTGDQIFYSAPLGADSSLVRPDVDNVETTVYGSRFDDLDILMPASSLLKMDAEGAEPEVLEGFGGELRNLRWLATDVGPERHGEST
jgi:FkbM family methyltransferase